jgi:class 3 adenylate cyclase/tetratricopeptide (TPR) repeat protein
MLTCANCGAENREGARFCDACGRPMTLAEAAEPFRKTVTVLFSDVVGSTSLGEQLDPEALSQVMTEYFDPMRSIVERHGGTLAKFVGDAVLAVFGIPTLHEDDALRAVRAAVEMRTELGRLNAEFERRFGVTISTRTGVNTGPVAGVGLIPDHNFVAGDTANVAARLQQLAEGGEILLGEGTYRLIRHAADAELLPPVELKGKAAPLSVYRLREVRSGGALPRRLHAPIIGRERERGLLAEAWERVASERTPHLLTVLGAAGVGKSRLTDEFLASLVGAGVVRGHCLSYGNGITFWPVVEILVQLLGKEPATRLEELGVDRVAAERIASLLGRRSEASSVDDLFWAVRKTLEAAAARRPLIVRFDDVHWGEEAFLDLVEHVADWTREAPILLLCLARPDLLERRPGWVSARPNATSVLLEPLSPEESARVLEGLGGRGDERLRRRILAAAEGNPLFLEEMVAMVEHGGDVAVLPPTIHALLAARLDQLPAGERAVLERAAIEGQVFHWGALRALLPDEPELSGRLQALVRKELLRHERPQFEREDAFRFRHLLIRDAAYEALPKRTRAELHERFARWLDQRGGELVEREELVGYHLEQSYRYASELGAADANALEAAARAAALLTVAGRRAFARGDMAAAAGLLRRAAALLEINPPRRLELLPELGRALRFAGHAASAEAVLREAGEKATATGDRRLVLLSRVEHAFLRLYTDPDVETEDTIEVAEQALAVFEEFGDDGALARAWALIGHANWLLCRGERMEDAFTRALECTRRTGDPQEEGWILRMLALVYCHGPTPVEQAIARCEEILELGRGHGAIEVSTRAKIAGLEAMRGRFELARDLYLQCRAIGEEFGVGPVLAALPNYSGPIELLAGDPKAAERELRAGCRALEELGETSVLSTSAALLARTLERTGQLDEAEEQTVLSERNASRDDLASQTTWRGVRARVLARRGEFDRAQQLARDAVAIADRTDFLVWRGEALLDLAEVHRLAGDSASFVRAANDALRLFEAKGHLVLSEQTRALLRESAVALRPA